MAENSKSLQGRVVVITGASSGIGREAAVQFAREGCRVVVAARSQEALEETAKLCREAGGSALVVRTDVTRETDVQNLTHMTLEALGRIDVWINNAGVTLFGLLSEATFEEHARVIETNVLGSMLGARFAIPQFKKQGHGVLINVGSVLAEVGQPFVPSYVVSKFAVRGLSEALRAEVSESPDIHVCTLLPFTIDTPHFQEGANVIGRKARALPPIQSAEKVARAMVDLARAPRRELHVPRIAPLGVAVHALFPRTTERLLLRALTKWHFDERPEPRKQGNLFLAEHKGGADVKGRRRPQISTATFLGWCARELVKMGAESLGRAAAPERAAKKVVARATNGHAIVTAKA